MAVDQPNPNKQTLMGTGTPTPGPTGRRRRSSSLMEAAQALPNVEHSLEEFIARANQTSVDAEQWGAGTPTDKAAKAEEDARKEQDALRWKNAELQMREAEAREGSLRRQLDGLQGKLAEAEARAAVAGSGTGAMQAAEALVADLRTRLDKAKTESMTAQKHAVELEEKLAKSAEIKAEGTPSFVRASSQTDTDGEERIRVAEAKAVKAIAAARAAAAGLTVSSADLAAIESGLVVTNLAPHKQTPWVWIAVAFVGGIALMFVASKALLGTGAAATPAQVAPTLSPAATVAPTPAPVVTPIEQPKAVVTPIETAPAPVLPPTAVPAVVTPVPAVVTPTPPPAVAPTPVPVHHAAPTHHTAPAAIPAKSGIADPFGDAPAPAAAKKTPAKTPAKTAPKAGAIVDPFAN